MTATETSKQKAIDYLDHPPQRYDLVFQKASGSREMVEDPKGEYVRFDDMDLYMFEGAQLMQQLEREIERLEAEVISAKTRHSDLATEVVIPLQAERDRLRVALEKILNFSDSAMRDGDGARDVAREALRGAHETTPSLSCPTCGLLYSGRGGQKGMPVRLSCPNGHEWDDPRGGCNS